MTEESGVMERIPIGSRQKATVFFFNISNDENQISICFSGRVTFFDQYLKCADTVSEINQSYSQHFRMGKLHQIISQFNDSCHLTHQ